MNSFCASRISCLVMSSAERQFRLAFLLLFDSGPEQLLEKSLTHQAIDNAVVDDLAKIEFSHLRSDTFVGRVVEHVLDRRGGNIGDALVVVDLGVMIVDALNVGAVLLVPCEVTGDGKCLVAVKTLDRLCMGLDQRLGETGVGRNRRLPEKIDRGSVDIVV